MSAGHYDDFRRGLDRGGPEARKVAEELLAQALQNIATLRTQIATHRASRAELDALIDKLVKLLEDTQARADAIERALRDAAPRSIEA